MSQNWNSKGHKTLDKFGYKNPVMEETKMEDNKEWTKLEGNVYKFETEGDHVEGKLVSVEPGKAYDNKVYHIEDINKKDITLFGTVILDSLLSRVPINSMIRIVYEGEKEATEKGKNPTKLFEVFVK